MTDTKITTRCPSCGHQTLFIGDGGHLTCSWLDCTEPGVETAIKKLQGKSTAYDLLEATLIAAGYARIVHKAQIIERPNMNDAGQMYAFPNPHRRDDHPAAPFAMQPSSGVIFERESPDDPQSTRRRGSAGNFEEMNAEVTGQPVGARQLTDYHEHTADGSLPAIDPKARE